MKKLIITIMAAGEGKRMKSDIPKVLHLFDGNPMLVRIIKESIRLNPQKIIVITGKYDLLIKETLSKYLEKIILDKIIYIQQKNPQGTSDAIKYTLDEYSDEDNVLILNGDMPLITYETLNNFISGNGNLLIAEIENPFGYGRIIKENTDDRIIKENTDGRIIKENTKNCINKIIEQKDCTEDEKKINLVNVGIYFFSGKILKNYIPLIQNNNAQNEYYLTDLVSIIKNNSDLDILYEIIDKDKNYQILGVNTKEELMVLEEKYSNLRKDNSKKFEIKKKDLILFDIDGTLTESRKVIEKDMIEVLHKLYQKKDFLDIGFVGGSDLSKQIEQLGEENFGLFKWRFSENGLMSYKDNELIHKKSIIDELGEKKYKKLINVCLLVLSETDIPVKRGNFIELRNGMINVSPIGRSCSQKERDEFYELDKVNKIRERVIERIKELFLEDILTFSIGGQISIDIFPIGWDKTYCLEFVDNLYNKIYFFGDKTEIGGNDYEIYSHSRVISNTVTSYKDTINFLENIFLSD
jgi:phosphomannomutase